MSSSDLFTADYPHGTPEGFDGPDGHDGCRGGACPGGDLWGLSCKRAKQLSRSDYQYQKLVAQGLTPEEIADKLGLMPEVGETRGKSATIAKPKKAKAPDYFEARAAGEERAAALRADLDFRTATKAPSFEEELRDQVDAEIATEEGPPAPAADAAEPTPKEIRAWATERGYEVKPMGKLPQYIIDHYWEAHGLLDRPANYAPAKVHTKTPETATEPAQVDTEAPESTTIIPEPAGPRPDWSHVTLTEDLARAQTDRDALAEELAEAKGELTRARGLAARLEEELARDREEHAAEISDLNQQLSEGHGGIMQRIEQLEEALTTAELATVDISIKHEELVARLRAERDEARRQAREIRGTVAVEKDETIASLSRALELALRKWAAERDRNQRRDASLEALKQQYKTAARQGDIQQLRPLTVAERGIIQRVADVATTPAPTATERLRGWITGR